LRLAAFAEAARLLKREDYRTIAKRNADFLLGNLRDGEGRLKRSYKDGQARLNGYLEDYANLAEGLLALYETTFDVTYFSTARDLANQILAHFTDPRGGFFDTSDDHESLVVRPKDVQDNATPSGGAMATLVLLKLAAYTGHPQFVDVGEAAVASLQPALTQAPTGFAWWLCALNFELAPPKEIAIVGENAQPLFDVVFGEYRPNQVVAYSPAPEQDLPIPLLGGRPQIGGKTTAYVCEHFTCQLPVTDAEALKTQQTN
jgi:uncharacterized protein YyaL (SSP411 family)